MSTTVNKEAQNKEMPPPSLSLAEQPAEAPSKETNGNSKDVQPSSESFPSKTEEKKDDSELLKDAEKTITGKPGVQASMAKETPTEAAVDDVEKAEKFIENVEMKESSLEPTTNGASKPTEATETTKTTGSSEKAAAPLGEKKDVQVPSAKPAPQKDVKKPTDEEPKKDTAKVPHTKKPASEDAPEKDKLAANAKKYSAAGVKKPASEEAKKETAQVPSAKKPVSEGAPKKEKLAPDAKKDSAADVKKPTGEQLKKETVQVPSAKKPVSEGAPKKEKLAPDAKKDSAADVKKPTGEQLKKETVQVPSAKKPANEGAPEKDKLAADAKKEAPGDVEKPASEEPKKQGETPKKRLKIGSKSVRPSPSISAAKRAPPNESEERPSKKAKKVAAKSILSSARSPGTWSGFQGDAGESAKPKSDKKREPDKKKAATEKKEAAAKKKSPTKTPSAKEIWSGVPDEPIEGGWPDGWTKKTFERVSGKTKGSTDSYWYSPIEKKKLRSMNEVKRFMSALKQANGDEQKAWRLFKGK